MLEILVTSNRFRRNELIEASLRFAASIGAASVDVKFKWILAWKGDARSRNDLLADIF